MEIPIKKPVLRIFLLMLIISSVWFVAFGARSVSITDPDQFFHFAISKMQAESGHLVRKLPQADDLGWGEVFPDKEYLFHVVTTFFYKIGGDEGVRLLVPALTSLILSGSFLLACEFVTPLWAFGIIFIFSFLSPHFYYRLIFVRPHILAITFFVALLGSVAKKKPWLVFISTALFALSYHAVIVPLTVIGACFLVGLFGERHWSRSCIAGLLGILVGILSNPFYPSNLAMMFTVLGMATNYQENAALDAGIELFPLPIIEFLRFYSLHILILVLAAASLYKARSQIRTDGKSQFLLWVFILSLFFLFLTLLSPRATEYASPALMLLTALLPLKKRYACIAGGIYIALGSFGFSKVYGQFFSDSADHSQSRAVLQALEALPKSVSGEKIFNCEWHFGSYILYARPDLKFVDLLDPHFLLEEDSKKAVLRIQLNHGQIKDISSVIKDVFHSQLVICANPRVIYQLLQDRDFKLLYPEKLTGYATPPFIFSLRSLSGS